MEESGKTLVQIMPELTALRQRIATLEAAVARPQSEEAWYEGEAKFRHLVEASPHGILVHRHYKPLFVNPAFARLYGYATPAEILNMETIMPFVAPHEQTRIMAPCQVCLCSDPMPVQFELQGLRQDGEPLWVKVRATVVPWEGLPAILTTSVDITERKQAEAALQQARLELEQRVEARTVALRQEMAEHQRLEREAQRAQHFALLGRLAAGVSHEIRNPLGAVFLHVDLLAEASTSLALALCVVFPAASSAQTGGTTPPAPASAAAGAPSTPALPVKRVILYKTGVGYFEHLGQRHEPAGRDDRVYQLAVERRAQVADGHRPREGPHRQHQLQLDRAARTADRRASPAARSARVFARAAAHAARRTRRRELGRTGSAQGRLLSVERHDADEAATRRVQSASFRSSPIRASCGRSS